MYRDLSWLKFKINQLKMNLKKRLTVVTRWLLYLGTYQVTNNFESHHNCELYKL